VTEAVHVSLTRLRELSKEATVKDESESAHIDTCPECGYLLKAFALLESIPRQKEHAAGEDRFSKSA